MRVRFNATSKKFPSDFSPSEFSIAQAIGKSYYRSQKRNRFDGGDGASVWLGKKAVFVDSIIERRFRWSEISFNNRSPLFQLENRAGCRADSTWDLDQKSAINSTWSRFDLRATSRRTASQAGFRAGSCFIEKKGFDEPESRATAAVSVVRSLRTSDTRPRLKRIARNSDRHDLRVRSYRDRGKTSTSTLSARKLSFSDGLLSLVLGGVEFGI